MSAGAIQPHESSFFAEASFVCESDWAFKVRYNVSCLICKIDHDAFVRSGFRQRGDLVQLVHDWNNEVFTPSLRNHKCSFKFLRGPNWMGPELCFIIQDNRESYIAIDALGNEILERLCESKFIKHGCTVEPNCLCVEYDADLNAENYRMIKMRKLKSIENSDEFRQNEEETVVASLQQHFRLRQELLQAQANNDYSSKLIFIKTRQAGSAIELSWKIGTTHDEAKLVLRGYRNDTGFVETHPQSTDHGSCVVQTDSPGKSVQQLEPGKEYFYSFFVTEQKPIYAQQNVLASVVKSPKLLRYETITRDVLRFAVRIPAKADVLRVECMLEKLQQRSVDPATERFKEARDKLLTYAELDDGISQLENELIAKIQRKKYSADKREDKILRIKGAVEALRLQISP